ncbi:MAG: DUF4250 domain-containing protein [Lachnospiraceae bacterium]|nr:DUF4250 domain-containing protein [Lachnospiraceae bacterium]
MLPKDPNMLLSMINMKLRDSGKNLEELCEDMDVAVEEVTEPLRQAGYVYDPEHNWFR